MDTAVIRQFLDYFQDFLHLCQLENWPNNDTTEAELKNAFLISKHIEKCMDRFQKNEIIDEFLSLLHSNEETSSTFLKTCLGDPPKYILKKIINSNAKVSQIDVGFQLFLQLFSEKRLEDSLTDLMLEAASKETLLRNLTQEIPKDKVVAFKSQILLFELHKCENTKNIVSEMLINSNQDVIDSLISCLLNKEVKYSNTVTSIASVFKEAMLSRNHSSQSFWKCLFKVDDKHFIQLCLDHTDLFKLIVISLVDCSKLLRENMSSEYFYIDITYSQLVSVVQRICSNDNLRTEFLNIVNDDPFWLDMTL
ncbi:uncharacterized protein LOC113510428 isoform X1 [Galleria mellonella]|uniref:Uncharacterized protein LOC113510428 isoform X1 n=1 Tax=Galleria mellonella TaxID=7137 RepID=A0A6J1WH98_GALME|nr:uncharacterized protein LOC113510428 isoform X1 [Galleria mellonella]XP_052749881.1 uncharacterized protein LOC113510428 isoform X1 [Galleria mellonella]